MEKSVLQQALEAMIAAGKIDGKLISYSGRGMYGRECMALTLDRSINPMNLGAMLALWAVNRDLDPEKLGEDLGSFYSDSLGRGVVYYWRSIKYVQA